MGVYTDSFVLKSHQSRNLMDVFMDRRNPLLPAPLLLIIYSYVPPVTIKKLLSERWGVCGTWQVSWRLLIRTTWCEFSIWDGQRILKIPTI